MAKFLVIFLLIFVYLEYNKTPKDPVAEAVVGLGPEDSFNASASCATFNFHYLETENVLYSPVVRHIEVFLDENAFSEETWELYSTTFRQRILSRTISPSPFIRAGLSFISRPTALEAACLGCRPTRTNMTIFRQYITDVE